jgi:hypothetical protein
MRIKGKALIFIQLILDDSDVAYDYVHSVIPPHPSSASQASRPFLDASRCSCPHLNMVTCLQESTVALVSLAKERMVQACMEVEDTAQDCTLVSDSADSSLTKVSAHVLGLVLV